MRITKTGVQTKDAPPRSVPLRAAATAALVLAILVGSVETAAGASAPAGRVTRAEWDHEVAQAQTLKHGFENDKRIGIGAENVCKEVKKGGNRDAVTLFGGEMASLASKVAILLPIANGIRNWGQGLKNRASAYPSAHTQGQIRGVSTEVTYGARNMHDAVSKLRSMFLAIGAMNCDPSDTLSAAELDWSEGDAHFHRGMDRLGFIVYGTLPPAPLVP